MALSMVFGGRFNCVNGLKKVHAMAHKTGFFHGSSALVGLLVAELLVHYCRPVFPAVIKPLENSAGASLFMTWGGGDRLREMAEVLR